MRKHALFEFSNTHYTIQRENAQVKSGEFSMNFCFSRKSQHIFAKKIKKFQTQAAKAVEKTASADRKPRISRG